MTDSKDTRGDRLKAQERVEAGRKADKTKPLMCRLDGKAFHTFTRGLKRPYDERLSQLMIDTTKYLVEHTHAKIGYCQSDEISLYWVLDLATNPEAQVMFDGKFQKLTSVLAGMASAFFSKELATRIPEKADQVAVFDARVWNVDTITEVYENFLWRQDDAIKNSISMTAQAHFSAKKLHGVGSEAKKVMLHAYGFPAWEDYPTFFKSGTFVTRKSVLVELTPEQLEKIPVEHWPVGLVSRTAVQDMGLGYIRGSFGMFL